MTSDEKQPQIPKFQGRPGIYVRGKVVPALEGVQITVTAERDSLAGGLKSGHIAMTSVTGSDGTYVAGPLYDDTSYVTQAALVCCSSHCTFLVVGSFLLNSEHYLPE